MSIRKLKSFIAVAEFSSFSDAADHVNLTAAAVGQQIKNLERDLGVLLFDRHKRSPQLNPSGQALLPKARELVDAYDNLASSLTDNFIANQEFTFGAVNTTMTGLVPKMLLSLRQEYENLRIKVFPALSDDLYAQVDRGKLDAAIISEPRACYRHLEWQPFVAEELIVIAPLNVKSQSPIELLESYPYIRFSRRAWVGQLIDEWLTGRNLNVKECMELETLESISTMVSHNLGVSIIPRECVPSVLQPTLTRLPLDPSAKPRRLGLIFRADSGMHKMVGVVLSQLVRIVEEAGEATVIVDRSKIRSLIKTKE